MNKRLLVLSDNENYDGVIYVYDIEKDVDSGITSPTPLIVYDVYTLDKQRNLYLDLTSF